MMAMEKKMAVQLYNQLSLVSYGEFSLTRSSLGLHRLSAMKQEVKDGVGDGLGLFLMLPCAPPWLSSAKTQISSSKNPHLLSECFLICYL